MSTFEVLWYNGGPEHAPNRVVGRDTVKRHDLTDAITWACNTLKAERTAGAADAHGFYVRVKRDDAR